MIPFNELSEDLKMQRIMDAAFIQCQGFLLSTHSLDEKVKGPLAEYIQYKKDMIDYIADKLGMEDLKGHLYPSDTYQKDEPK